MPTAVLENVAAEALIRNRRSTPHGCSSRGRQGRRLQSCWWRLAAFRFTLFLLFVVGHGAVACCCGWCAGMEGKLGRRRKKGEGRIISNNICSTLNLWYEYSREREKKKGDEGRRDPSLGSKFWRKPCLLANQTPAFVFLSSAPALSLRPELANKRSKTNLYPGL